MLQFWTWAAPDRDGICAAQTLGAAGALTINGALADLDYYNKTGQRRGLLGSNVERTLSLYSSGDLTGVDFTIVGVDTHGQTVTEVLTGPNNTTVYSTKNYASVTSITADDAVGTAVEAGSGTTGTTSLWPVNHKVTPCCISVAASVTGTINWDVEHTFDNVFAAGYNQSAGVFFEHEDLTGETASGDGNYAFYPTAIRFKVNSSGADGALAMTLIQGG